MITKKLSRTIREVSIPELNKESLHFYALSMLTSFLNFCFYPILARITDQSNYGEIQFYTQIIYQFSVVFIALNIVIIIISSRYKNEPDKLNQILSSTSSLFNLANLFLTLLIITTLLVENSKFQINGLSTLAMGLAVFTTVPFTIAIGKLQGESKFILSGVLSSIGSGLKIIVASLLVLFGLGTLGALLGIAISQLAIVLYVILSKRADKSHLLTFKFIARQLDKDTIRMIAVVMISIILVNMSMAIDMLSAKLLYAPEQAGNYAAIATFSKIIIFLISPLMWLSVSEIANHQSYKTIRKKILIAVALLLTMLAGYYVVGERMFTLIMGSKYDYNVGLLLYSTLANGAIAIAALTNAMLAASDKLRQLSMQTVLIIIALVLTIQMVGFSSVYSALTAELIGGLVGFCYYIYIQRSNYVKAV